MIDTYYLLKNRLKVERERERKRDRERDGFKQRERKNKDGKRENCVGEGEEEGIGERKGGRYKKKDFD